MFHFIFSSFHTPHSSQHTIWLRDIVLMHRYEQYMFSVNEQKIIPWNSLSSHRGYSWQRKWWRKSKKKKNTFCIENSFARTEIVSFAVFVSLHHSVMRCCFFLWSLYVSPAKHVFFFRFSRIKIITSNHIHSCIFFVLFFFHFHLSLHTFYDFILFR